MLKIIAAMTTYSGLRNNIGIRIMHVSGHNNIWRCVLLKSYFYISHFCTLTYFLFVLLLHSLLCGDHLVVLFHLHFLFHSHWCSSPCTSRLLCLSVRLFVCLSLCFLVPPCTYKWTRNLRMVCIALDSKNTGWAIDGDGMVWFRTGVTKEKPMGDDQKWWQVSLISH